MKLALAERILVILTLAAGTALTQTFLDGASAAFPCMLEPTDNPQWIDNTDNIIIFNRDGLGNPVKPLPVQNNPKYEHYQVDNSQNLQFDLKIDPIRLTDIGNVTCQDAALISPIEHYAIDIEVPPDQLSISCESCDGGDAEPTCQCTCFAEGGYPQSLNITWDVNSGRTASIQLESEMKDGKYDFTGTANVTVTTSNAVVTCSVKGYVNQAEIEHDFPDRVIQEQTLTSPTDCGLTLEEAERYPDGDCNVQLNCSCQGVPPINTCTFYNGTQGNDIPDKNSCSINYRVPLGTEASFLCSGSNGINFGQDFSDLVPFECIKATTPTPTEAEATIPPKDGGLDAAIIAVIVVVCIVILLAVIIGTVVIFKKREEGGGKNDNTDGNGANAKLAPEQPEYAAVNKPKSQPQAAPRPRSQPPDNNEQMELQYADLDHGNRGRTNEIHQPVDEPTQYAEVKSVIV